jgi:hypothetical protein
VGRQLFGLMLDAVDQRDALHRLSVLDAQLEPST